MLHSKITTIARTINKKNINARYTEKRRLLINCARGDASLNHATFYFSNKKKLYINKIIINTFSQIKYIHRENMIFDFKKKIESFLIHLYIIHILLHAQAFCIYI